MPLVCVCVGAQAGCGGKVRLSLMSSEQDAELRGRTEAVGYSFIHFLI